jgi:hypothetical protein
MYLGRKCQGHPIVVGVTLVSNYRPKYIVKKQTTVVSTPWREYSRLIGHSLSFVDATSLLPYVVVGKLSLIWKIRTQR